MRFLRIISLAACSIMWGYALDFGVMGNVAAGMGGAGVAVKNSPFALYYNPALLTAENSVRFGYSAGLLVRDNHFSSIVNSKLFTITDLSQLNDALDDILRLQTALQENALHFTSQNGIAAQLAPSLLRGTLGAIGIGLFSSLYGSTSAHIDTNRMALIIKSNEHYYNIITHNGTLSYAPTSQEDYTQHSLEYALQQGDAHALITRGLFITEIPIGYAHTLYSKNINWNLGMAMRLMSGSNAISRIPLTLHTDMLTNGLRFFRGGSIETKNAIALDIGTMLEIDLPDFRYVSLGLVAKNLNTPTFSYSTGEIAIKPQYRAGIAYNQPNIVLAFDVDLLKNEVLSDSFQRPFSQMIGGGVKFDVRAFDLRAGVMKDMRQDDGVILTCGINILGLVDVAMQVGTEGSNLFGYPLPRYFHLRVGGNMSF